MDNVTFKFWVDRAGQLEEDRNHWRRLAKRLANPVHDANCEFAGPCGYCDALKAVEDYR